jgi:hypothetical protein
LAGITTYSYQLVFWTHFPIVKVYAERMIKVKKGVIGEQRRAFGP